MRRAGLPLAAAVLVAAAGCESMAVAGDAPARIVAPDEASSAALQETVNRALGTDVPLAADALTTASVLMIERRVPRSIDGQDAYGRTTEAPLQFRLVKNGADCVLIDPRDGARYVLENTECAAE
jgi:hypothetical protein